ncbi:hypothetical protein Nepgr_002128 [Nepenthes gracilis]|uniref:Uncharacterized protein n=1 Tax=Nepenthes gracilis TaxID=150966 RepID=A0AAD3RXK1_NEPGR|nr:hypothetical protein Nepgr_002128 [Nepenthes gracilis]
MLSSTPCTSEERENKKTVGISGMRCSLSLSLSVSRSSPANGNPDSRRPAPGGGWNAGKTESRPTNRRRRSFTEKEEIHNGQDGWKLFNGCDEAADKCKSSDLKPPKL